MTIHSVTEVTTKLNEATYDLGLKLKPLQWHTPPGMVIGAWQSTILMTAGHFNFPQPPQPPVFPHLSHLYPSPVFPATLAHFCFLLALAMDKECLPGPLQGNCWPYMTFFPSCTWQFLHKTWERWIHMARSCLMKSHSRDTLSVVVGRNWGGQLRQWMAKEFLQGIRVLSKQDRIDDCDCDWASTAGTSQMMWLCVALLWLSRKL